MDSNEQLVEQLSAKFHDIYQQEAKRQGDVRHKDAYADLPENIKEFDRVLARFVISQADALVAAAVEECAKAMCDRCRFDGPPRDCINDAYQPPDGGPRFIHIDSDEMEVECAASAIRALTPPAIRRALELREVKVQLEEARNLWHQDFVEAYNGGTLTAQGREILRKRIAELEHRREELEGEKHV